MRRSFVQWFAIWFASCRAAWYCCSCSFCVCVRVRVRVRVRVCMYERKSVNLCETELINGAYTQACVAAVVCDCCYA